MTSPIKLYPETTPSWLSDPVQAVPTLDDLKAAVAETYEAFERFNADREAGRDTTESHASYMCAIERQCDLNNQRFVAALKEAPVCPSI